MASAISHPAVLVALSPWLCGAAPGARVWLIAAAASILPDLDALGFWLGIPYGAPLGHRGLTHSLFFAAAIAMASFFTFLPGRPRRLLLFLFLCIASHGVLDAMTDGGLGVAFFAPFDNTRYFLPWRPIRVSPIGVRGFLGRRGLEVLGSELIWIWIPCVALGAFGRLVKGSRPGHA